MTNHSLSVEKRDALGWRNPWVRACIGLLLTVVMVNLGFVMVSSSSNPGLVTEEYYKYGMQQNKQDKMFRKQIERGWQVDLSMPVEVEPGKAFDLQVNALNKQGEPVSGGRMELICYRASDASQDITIALKEISNGKYAASVTLPVVGIWDINLLFESGGEQHSVGRRIRIGKDSESISKHTTLDNIVNWLSK
jgi:nitrogen fixation protein FixH